MVLFGVKFEETMEDIRKYAQLIRDNSEKKESMIMFNVKVFVPDNRIMFIWKDFVLKNNLLKILLTVDLLSLVPLFLWNFWVLTIVISILISLIALFDTPEFNFLIFKMMLKKNGYKGKVKLL